MVRSMLADLDIRSVALMTNNPSKVDGLRRDGVIVTRQGRGTFVAENVDLGRDLRGRELDEHLAAAARIGNELGLDPDTLADRMREMAESKDRKGT